MITRTPATLEDLMRVPGKAELVNGEIVHMPPTGDEPGSAGDEIYASLRQYVLEGGAGRAVSDNKAFRVDLPHRQSFSPDAAYYVGPRRNELLPAAAGLCRRSSQRRRLRPSRRAGDGGKTSRLFRGRNAVVWDVDLLSEDVVRKYSAAAPDHPTLFRRGEIADAEPAVPGWKMKVDDLFR